MSVLWHESGRRDFSSHGQSARPVLSVATFNAQFLPGLAQLWNKRPHADYRATALAAVLKGYDLIALNEVFDHESQSLLFSELRKEVGTQLEFVTSPENAVSPFGIGSGLVLITSLPISSSHFLAYGNDSNPLVHGVFADGFAAKGVLHARVLLDDSGQLDVFVTHLESRNSLVREDQFTMLAGFIASHSRPDYPLLLLGDLNVPGGEAHRLDRSSQYHKLVSRLQSAYPHAPLIDLGASLKEDVAGTGDVDRRDGGERIDYIFLACPPGAQLRLQPRSVKVDRFADRHVTTLSDHLAVTAEITVVP